MIDLIPDYIFVIPSSTSLKYHNATQCQAHGQIYHILMFAEIMNYILNLEYIKEKKVTSAIQRDLLRCTPIFHDAYKCGKDGSKYTVHDHPMIAGEWIENTVVEHDIPASQKKYLADLCRSHSGQWTTGRGSATVLPKPQDDIQFLVHMCDYLASRSNLDMTYPDAVKAILDGVDVPQREVEIPDVNTWVLPFGKYKGKTYVEINALDPGYISWSKENITKEPMKTLLNNF